MFFKRMLPLVLVTGMTCHAGGEWKTLTGCTLIRNQSNDGDSFHVRHHGREYIFRLYFVDCPETSTHVKERINEQGTYWRKKPEDIPKLGEMAARFALKHLQKGPFTVYTRFQDAKGSSDLKRHFAFVKTASGDDLSYLLVEHGWGRTYGASASNPGGNSESKYWIDLHQLEKRAKSKRLGAWGKGEAQSMTEDDAPRKKTYNRGNRLIKPFNY